MEGSCSLIKTSNINCILLRIKKISKKRYIFSNHKITSMTDPLTEIPTPTDLDLIMLKKIPLKIRKYINYIALSFATYTGIKLLRKYLDKNGYINSKIIAKIESKKGVCEIESISKLNLNTMLALDDLSSVCKRLRWDLNSVLYKLINVANKYNNKIFAAGSLALSLNKSDKLNNGEIRILKILKQLGVNIFGLTRETFTTFDTKYPENTLKIINNFINYLKDI